MTLDLQETFRTDLLMTASRVVQPWKVVETDRALQRMLID